MKLEALKEIRKKRKMTRKDLAQKSGVAEATIVALESGLSNVENAKLSTLMALCEALWCPLEVLYPQKKKFLETAKNKTLDDEIPICEIVHVFGSGCCFMKYITYEYGGKLPTFEEILKEAHVDKHGVYYIICESALHGNCFLFGNYDDDIVYFHGETKGYA